MDIITIDTETGGLIPSQHALLAIGAACSWSNETLEHYITADFQPLKGIDPQAAEKNGYTPEAWTLLKAIPCHIAIARLYDWIEQRFTERPSALLVCHNLAFDKPFIAEAAVSLNLGDLARSNRWRCSQNKFSELMDSGHIPAGSASLDRLAELSGWPHPRAQSHNALQDAQIALHGYQWLLEQARRQEYTLRALYTESLRERRRLDDLFVKLGAWMDAEADWAECGEMAALICQERTRVQNEKKEVPDHG